jgi:hypothetical protein
MKYLSVKKIIYFEILKFEKEKENFNILLHPKKSLKNIFQNFWK